MLTQTPFGFRPVQGSDDAIHNMPYTEGHLYFATDTGKMYLDAEGIDKIPLGGGGAAVLYANSANVKERADGSYTMPYNDLEDETAVPKETDLIINIDGSFYKVLSADKDSNMIHCNRIAVSGTGGGGGNYPGGGDTPGGDGSAFVIKLAEGYKFPTSFIYGQPYMVGFDVNAPTDEQVTLTFTIQSSDINADPKSYSVTCPGKGIRTFDIGSVLPAESGLAIKVQAIGDNDGISNALYYRQRNVIEMQLKPSTNFNPRVVASGAHEFKCVPIGADLVKTLKIYIDGVEQRSLEQSVTSSGREVSVTIPEQGHGVHTIKAVLTSNTGLGEVTADPLEYEIAWDDGESTEPLIWFGSYPKVIQNHDKLLIEYMIYTPKALTNISKVNRWINDKELIEIDVTYNIAKWEVWNVTDYTMGTNTLIISSDGRGARTIQIEVNRDTEREDFHVITSGLLLNLDSKGRSNKENITKRQEWIATDALGNPVTAVSFNDKFNWFSNGWIVDDDNNSCLRISNGASISIPLDVMRDPIRTKPLTIECIFKLRNVQNLSTLITTTSSETEDGKVIIEKSVNISEGVFAKYYNQGIGMCLGTQEAFFKTNANAIVNARYVDNDMVHVTFVVEDGGKTTPLIYIYLNGINSGTVSYIPSADNLGSEATEITFNSEYCDIDLYKLRVYDSALTAIDVVQNYVADINDPELYDMNQICDFNTTTFAPYVDYNKVRAYNEKYPDKQTIPYAVVEVHGDTTDERLPFVKDGKRDLDVTFINPALDRAYAQGLITAEQYITGAPSFRATKASFDVQGTSSQGYPRRNYKGKFKDATAWEYLDGPLKGKTLLENQTIEGSTKEYKHFYMDNKDASESTFTWKADYMESSMTHNTGFASFVKTLYSHHPLVDYDPTYVTGDHRTTVYGFPMLLFQRHKDGTYEFVGRYNFNLDKGCNNVIDFKNGNNHPYVPGKKYKDVAQCWEFCNNQHTRCSFKTVNFSEVYPEGHKKAGQLTVLDDFEYRYNHDDDKLDAAIELNTEVFPEQSLANAYILSEYTELEKLALWLESTDIEKADPNRALRDDEVKRYGETDYTHDTVEYRLAKFTYEFTKHFNPEYCYVYFIMTELLLQYDSRGKNCMLASWGPQEEGGEYIWYPIFYDIDTQLGVNNSGVPTWEYYVEATRDRQFSTPDSVLWNNLWTCFQGPIRAKYIELRKNALKIEKLNGYYNYDPAVSHSYAMTGVKPISIINVDEYYKYIAPAFTGYIDTSGNTARTNLYFYCLQGTRELHRKQFLRNRFNFLDSQWLAGTYDVNAVLQELKIRYNTSDAINTSDKFITQEPILVDEAAVKAWESFQANGGKVQPYKQSPLDGDLNFTVTPYLRQYVSMYFDDTPTVAQAFTEDPVTITPFPNIQSAVEKDISYSQQLIYFGGVEYISKFGDLSLKYPNEFAMNKAIRLKELYLGNDADGYYNNSMKDEAFTLAASKYVIDEEKGEIENPQGKPLLETVVLTNIGTITSNQDLTSCEKLKVFRALGTGIGGVLLAEGVPVEMLYLPATVTHFTLTEPTNLKGLLTSTPRANDQGVFPNGLFLEGITSEIGKTIAADKKIKLYKLDITGGKMGYDSYKLAKTIVDIKKAMQANTALDSSWNKNLWVNLKDVNWTPYRLVESGEKIISGATYVKKTDHYTFESYNPGSTWDKDTLNGKVYQVDLTIPAADINSLDSFEMLDTFIESYLSEENYFRYSTGSKGTLAHLSGNIFINNTTPIKESEIKNYYNHYFPDLNIFVANVEKSYTAKFLEIMESGQEYEWGVLKFDPETTTYPRLPIESDNIKPSKLHYDFKGWVASPGSMKVLSDSDLQTDNYKFSQTNAVYNFYAYYELDTYDVKFYDGDVYIVNIPKRYNDYLTEPSSMPVYRGTEPVGFYERYAFVGWTDDKNASGIISAGDVDKIVRDVGSYLATKNFEFYACYVKENVHEVMTPAKYFRFELMDDGQAYGIGVNRQYNISGKITLPIVTPEGALDGNGNPVPAGKTITSILKGRESIYDDKNFSGQSDHDKGLTHIFWLGGASAQTNITTISQFAFANNTYFEYFEFPKNCIEVQRGAFANNKRMSFGNDEDLPKTKLPDTLVTIGESAFSNAFGYNAVTLEKTKTLFVPASVQTIGTNAFYGLEVIDSVEIGTSDAPSQLNLGVLGSNRNIFGQLDAPYVTPITALTIYVSSTSDASAYSSLHDMLNMTKVASTNVVPV